MGTSMRCGKTVYEEWEEKKYCFKDEMLSNNFVYEETVTEKHRGEKETLTVKGSTVWKQWSRVQTC